MGFGQFQGLDFLALLKSLFPLPQHLGFAPAFQLMLDGIPGCQRFFAVPGASECSSSENLSAWKSGSMGSARLP